MTLRLRAALTLSLSGLAACVGVSDAMAVGQTAGESGRARLAALTAAFVATDWVALADESFTERDRTVTRHGIIITPPGERFAAWMATGTISEPTLEELIVHVETRLTALIEAEGVTLERRYPAAEVPPLVIRAIWFDDEEHAERRKGFGLALRSGDATAHAEVIATPFGDEWRIDGLLREPIEPAHTEPGSSCASCTPADGVRGRGATGASGMRMVVAQLETPKPRW